MLRFLAIALIYVSSIASPITFSTADIDNAKGQAKDIGSTLAGDYRNKSGLQERSLDTMSSSQEITTVDGTQRATANISCSNTTSHFAEISYSGISDISINVKIDYNQDGSIDNNLNFSGISGVFASGVAVCGANTFSNCNYYTWGFNSATESLELSQIHWQEAGGLYCINSSCESVSAHQKQRILQDISGAIANILQSNFPSLVLSQTAYNNDTMFLYGQDYSNCQNASSATYNAGSSIPSVTTLSSQASSQQTSSNDAYYVVTTTDYNEMQLNPVTSADKADIEAVAAKASDAKPSADMTSVNYTNAYKDENGNLVTSSDSSTMLIDPTHEVKSCMVKWSEVQTNVASDGQVIGHTGSGLATVLKTEIRECTTIDFSVCPVLSNETIKYDCGNLANSMGEGIAALQTASEMAKDLTCSTH